MGKTSKVFTSPNAPTERDLGYAQGVRDTQNGTVGVAKVGAGEPTPKPLDDPRLQELFGAAITGAMALGYQNSSPPPEGHWLTQHWNIGRAQAELTEKSGREVEKPSAGPRPNAEIVWPQDKSVKRRDDMSHSDAMQVGIDESGDLQVSLWTEKAGYSSVEFCAPGSGGGRSPETRRALIALMVAMEKDNGIKHAPAGAGEPRNSAGETPTEHAHRWATELAVNMHRKFYPEVTQWKPLPDLLGVITQIDNMSCGLVRAGAGEPTEPSAEVDLFDDIITKIKFEPLTRHQQYEQLRRIVRAGAGEQPSEARPVWQGSFLDAAVGRATPSVAVPAVGGEPSKLQKAALALVKAHGDEQYRPYRDCTLVPRQEFDELRAALAPIPGEPK